MAFLDEQRLAFGSVAGLYHRARPSYPAAAIDDVLAHARLAPGDRVLEVGAGTGKATVLLWERGLRVLALEPSASMAAVARATCPEAEVVEADFERWVAAERFPALVSVQAWHWIDPAVRYERAHAALEPGGSLAAIWTFPDWSACDLREPLAAAYARAAPHLAPDFPMHPASQATRLAGDWAAEIEAGERFVEPEVTLHAWSQRYTATAYGELLATHQDHILLAAGDRERLLSEIAAVIEDAPGGVLRMPFVTRVCVARRR